MSAQPTPCVTEAGTLPDGRRVQRIVISDGTLTAAFLTLGTTLQDLRLAGVPHALVVGTDDVAAYAGPLAWCGALVGPVANRISDAQARLAGRTHVFDPNEGGHTTLHGGAAGTHAILWEIDTVAGTSVTFQTSLRDGDGGFPGNRVVAARYALTEPGTLEMTVTATTDAATWINFANHSYWCLDGCPGFAGQSLTIAADRVCAIDGGALVTGEVASVAGSDLDFRAARRLVPGAPPLDHNFCLSERQVAPREVAVLAGTGGVTLRLETTEPGLQVHDGGGLPDMTGHDGTRIGRHAGLALEPQGWPDAPNRRHFPSVVLRAGHAYRQITRWRLSV